MIRRNVNSSILKIRLLALLIASCGLLSYGQQPTIISGKVTNSTNRQVILLVYMFDTLQLDEQEIRYQTRLSEDNTFSFVTNGIRRENTFCRIGFDNEGMKLRISPGDSLYMEFAAGAMDSTITFTGASAGINRYLKELELFNKRTARETYDRLKNLPDSSITGFLQDRRAAELARLFRADSAGELGQRFVELEQGRIDCEYLNGLMGRDVREISGDSVAAELIRPVLQTVGLHNDSLLFDLREYRNFIQNYIGFTLEQTKDERYTVQDYLNLANRELSGWVYVWYARMHIERLVNRMHDPRNKALLVNYFMDHSPDIRLTRILESLKQEPSGMSYSPVRSFRSTYGFLAGVLALVALVAFLVFMSKYVSQFRFPGNSALILFWGLVGLILVMAVVYLIGDFYPGNRLEPVLRVATILAFLGINVVVLIPGWFERKRYSGFLLLLAVLSVAYILILGWLGDRQSGGHNRIAWLRHYSAIFIIISWLATLLAAFTLHFLSRAITSGKRLSQLLSENRITVEVVFNVLLVATLFVHSLIVDRNLREGLSNTVILLTGAAIFYLHVFWVIPLIKSRSGILMYIGRSAVLVLPTLLVFYIADRILLHQSLTGLGLRVPWIEVIRWPGSQLIRTVLLIQLVMVPAWLYAWVKVQLLQKSIGFSLFRNKEAQLNQLRSQVNPHFLFNSLNTLYALSLKEQSIKTAEYIAKLANLMRYLIDDMEKERIPVQKEISYIRDYINLQAIRSSVDHRIDISDELGEEVTLLIAPMLMIPFVENAFKHGINPNRESELKINFQFTGGSFQFVIENSVDRNFESFYKEKGFGIGIENVRQRLAHEYPGRHTLSIADTGNRFIVILTILETENN